jgi:Golgi phosphoprotein 3
MLDLVEEMVLLAIEDDGAVSHTAGTLDFRWGMVGACLVDLNTHGRIDMDMEKIHILSDESVNSPALDLVLGLLRDGPPRNPVDWIAQLGDHSKDIIRHAIESLIARGILDQQEKRFLWVMKTRRYPVIDGKEQTEAKLRIVSLLLSDDLPTPHDSVLIGLANASGLLEGFLSTAEVARLQDRLEQIGGLDLIASAVRQALARELERVAQTMMVTSVY